MRPIAKAFVDVPLQRHGGFADPIVLKHDSQVIH